MEQSISLENVIADAITMWGVASNWYTRTKRPYVWRIIVEFCKW